MALLPMRNERNDDKKLKSDSCKAKCVFADFFLSIDMSGKEERIRGWSLQRCMGFAILKMGEKN